uniref:Transcription factor SPT20 homolog n=1 Tax=Globodera pallida TaxID=36090 RepID=A0A183BSN7_GLOPA
MKGALILLVVCIILELNLVHAQLRTEDEAQPKRQDEQMSKLDNARLVKGTEYQQVKAIEGAERQPSLLSATAPGAARVAHDGHDQQQLNAGHKIEKVGDWTGYYQHQQLLQIADQKLEGAGGIESRQFKLEPKTSGAQPIHDQQQQPKTAIEGGSSRQNEPQYRLPAQGRIDNYGGDYGHDQQQQKNNAEQQQQQQFKTEQEQRRQLITEGAQASVDTKMTQPRVGVEPKSFEESKQLSQDAARPFETKLGQPKTESTASQRQFEGANEQMAGPDLFSTAARIASRVYGDDQRQNNEQQREDKFRQTQTHFIEGDSRAIRGEQQQNKLEGDNKQPVRGEQQEVRQADPSLALERARARERQAKLEAETRAKVRQAEHRARIGLGGGHADAPAEQQQQQLDHPSKPGQVLEQQQKQFNNQQKFGEQQAKPQPQQAAEHNANQPFVGQQAKNQQAVEHQQANPLLINTPQMRENVAPQPLAAAGH